LRTLHTGRQRSFFDLSLADKILALAFAHLIYGFHFLPEYGVHILRQNPVFIPVFIAVITTFVAFRDRIRQKQRRFYWFATGLYYSVLTAYLSVIFFLSLISTDPWLIAVFFLWAAPIFIWKKYRRLRLFFAIHLLALAPLFFWVDSRCPDRSPMMIASYLLLIGFGYAVLMRRKVFALFGVTPLLFFVFASIAFPTLFARVQGIDTDRQTKIVAQKGVDILYSYDSPAYENMGSHYMFAAPFDDSILLGPHDPNEHFHLFQPASLHAAQPLIESLHILTRAGDMAAFDPLTPDVIYVGGWRSLFQLGIKPFRVLQQIPLEGDLFNMVRVDEKKHFLFASQDRGKRVVRLDFDNLEAPVYSPSVGKGRITFDVVLDPDRNKYYAGALGLDGWHIFEGDEQSLKLERHTVIPDAFGFFMEIDRQDRRLFLASFFTGHLLVLDLDRMTVIERIPMRLGYRNLTFDEKRRLLYGSDYFKGFVIVFDVDQSRIIGKIEVGSFVRHLQMGPKGDRLYARSSSGVFVIDIDEALGTIKP
jgi:hypothetical protein